MLTAIPSNSLRLLIILPYFLLIIAGLAIPSDGSHGILNVKSLSFITANIGLFYYVLINKKFTIYQWQLFCFVLCSLFFLLLWAGIAIFYSETPPSSTWEQGKILWLTVSVVAFSVFLNSEGLVTFTSFLKTVIITNFIYSFLKILIVALHVFEIVNMWEIINHLGIRFMSMDIYGSIPRFQTSIDIVTPFLLFFFLQSKNFGVKWNKYFYPICILVSLIAIFLSFSRFLAFIAFLSIILHCLTLNLRKLLFVIPLFIFAIGSLIAWIGTENIYTIFEKRFLSSETMVSDDTRSRQINELIHEYSDYPLLGKGLGSYANNDIRDPSLPYSYEVQWVSTLMQFGLAGTFFLILILGLIGNKILSRPINRSKIALFILYLSWLASGFTNPFLVSLASGILYSLFYLAPQQLDYKKIINHREQ